MYIFGGAYRKGNGSNFHSFHECQLKLDNNKDDLFKWRRIQGEAPKLRDSHSCISFHDHLLIFGGGSNNECFNDLYKFSITNKIWTKLESISDNGCPSPREGHVAVLVEGDKMLVHGGINENQVCFNDAYILVGLH
jgi:N-acetylneuraminic acid mutarotase